MKRLISLSIFLTLGSMKTFSQDQLPFKEISDYPEEYNSGTVAARIIDGLGFRFYWATDSLRDEDLSYKPSEEARTSLETIEHVYNMSLMIKNATTATVNSREKEELSFDEMRKQTLFNLQIARVNLVKNDNLESMKIIFEGKNGRTEYPFWNHLNGPIADCLWHVGQIVSFRRSSGNPIAAYVSFFNGKIRD